MRIKAIIKHENGESWEESYNTDDFEYYKSINNLDDATELMQAIIDLFNRYLRPGERPRELVRVESDD
ncbi:MAG: hypothetical protein WC346_05015 [Methanogenium sp.]|jgi:hypothetical protein